MFYKQVSPTHCLLSVLKIVYSHAVASQLGASPTMTTSPQMGYSDRYVRHPNNLDLGLDLVLRRSSKQPSVQYFWAAAVCPTYGFFGNAPS